MSRRKTTNEPVEEELLAETESETMAHHKTEASADDVAANIDEQAEVATTFEEGVDVDQVVPAEVAAIHVGNESSRAANKDKPKPGAKTKVAKSKTTKKPTRSAKYIEAKKLVEVGKLYRIEEAIALAKELSLSKFDGAIEIHLRLSTKKTKGSTESLRGLFQLPHGSGKNRKIIILDEAKIEQIAKTKRIDFDVAIATPALMPLVAKIAKILGPKGKMPDPKSGTVTNDPKQAIEEINSGRAEYRIDANNNVHQIVGRASWDDHKLIDNTKVVLGTFPRNRLMAAFVCPSIGPSVPLDLTKL